jgi:hypothetical protein
VICSPILPSCLDLRPGITFPPICAHAVVPPSLTMSRTLILVRVSCSCHKCTTVPLEVLPSPLSSCLQKQEIVQNNHANCTLSCCQRWLLWLPHFHGLLPMQSFSGGKPDIDCIRLLACCRCNLFPGGSRISIGRMADMIFLWGKQRKRVWILAYCQTIPPPPLKGECLECAHVTLLFPVGRWRGEKVGDRDEVHGCRRKCCWFLGGSTDSSVAEPNLCFFLWQPWPRSLGRPQGRLLGQRWVRRHQ